MSVNIALLVFGLALLWFPRQWMRLGRVVSHRHRRARGTSEPWKHREPGDPRLGYDEFRKIRNYFDLLRAVAGGLAIVGWGVVDSAFVLVDATNRGAARQILIAKLAIVMIGV